MGKLEYIFRRFQMLMDHIPDAQKIICSSSKHKNEWKCFCALCLAQPAHCSFCHTPVLVKVSQQHSPNSRFENRLPIFIRVIIPHCKHCGVHDTGRGEFPKVSHLQKLKTTSRKQEFGKVIRFLGPPADIMVTFKTKWAISFNTTSIQCSKNLETFSLLY